MRAVDVVNVGFNGASPGSTRCVSLQTAQKHAIRLHKHPPIGRALAGAAWFRVSSPRLLPPLSTHSLFLQ